MFGISLGKVVSTYCVPCCQIDFHCFYTPYINVQDFAFVTQNFLLLFRILSWFSLSVVSNSLWPSYVQLNRLPCPLSSPRACSNSCPLNQWCHPTISSSVTPFSSCLQSLPVSGSFPMSQFFASGGQSIGTSALASFLWMSIQGWFPLGLTGLILPSKGLSRVFSRTTVRKHQVFSSTTPRKHIIGAQHTVTIISILVFIR